MNTRTMYRPDATSAAAADAKAPRRRLSWRALLVAFIFGALVAALTHAQPGAGDLLVTPTRVVFEGRQRTAQITLVNRGAAAATYRIAFTNLRMNEEGGTKEIETSGAEPGELLVYTGSVGFLEVAVRDGSAAERLGARSGAPVVGARVGATGRGGRGCWARTWNAPGRMRGATAGGWFACCPRRPRRRSGW